MTCLEENVERMNNKTSVFLKLFVELIPNSHVSEENIPSEFARTFSQISSRMVVEQAEHHAGELIQVKIAVHVFF